MMKHWAKVMVKSVLPLVMLGVPMLFALGSRDWPEWFKIVLVVMLCVDVVLIVIFLVEAFQKPEGKDQKEQ